MVMKCTAVCLVALSLLGSFCNGQQKDIYRNLQHLRPMPRTATTQQNTQEAQLIQQITQSFQPPLDWKYPKNPTFKPQTVVPFQLRYPIAAATVAVNCREHDAYVEVKQDLFGTGQLINPADLTLGTCAVTSVDTANQVLIFAPELQNCGSSLSMTSDAIIYSFTLNYNPQPLGSAPVVRTNQASVIVECHYPRMHNVSSLPLDPLWIPFSAVRVAEEFLYFNLTLMTDDWQNVRPSYQYFLGDMINIEASVQQYFHVPLRVYVSSCIATLSPDTSSSPSYIFIDNGCMVDAIITGSNSKFMDRTSDNILQFQLEAFMFTNAQSGKLYITCHLMATSTAHPIDNDYKACSYINGWKEASGVNAACDTCTASGIHPPVTVHGTPTLSPGTGSGSQSYPMIKYPYSIKKIRDLSHHEFIKWETEVCMGPFEFKEKLRKEAH